MAVISRNRAGGRRFLVPSFATQLSTGAILGGGRDQRKWYVSYEDAAYAETFAGSAVTAIKGKLPNIRLIQGIWRNVAPSGSAAEDMTESDADNNLAALIASLDAMRSFGILSIGVGLQGGNPVKSAGADQNANVDQTNFTYDLTNWTPSAYNSDGTLKAAHKARMEMLLAALDSRHMTMLLGMFYGRQNPAIPLDANVDVAIDNTCTWLQGLPRRNYAVVLANEAASGSGTGWWGTRAKFHDPANCATMINRFKDNWAGQPWRPAVTVSVEGMSPAAQVQSAGDYMNIHGNGSNPTSIGSACASLVGGSGVGPVIMDENEQTEASGPVSSTRTTEDGCNGAMIDNGGSPGTMLSSKHQRFHSDSGPSEPFWWEVHPSSTDFATGTYREKWSKWMRAWLTDLSVRTGGAP